MGAAPLHSGVVQVRAAVRECLGEGHSGALELFASDDQELLLRVVRAPIEDSRGVQLSGYTEGQNLRISELFSEPGLHSLGWRYRDKTRPQWPMTYRFQASKKSWHSTAVDEHGYGKACLLQMAASPEERTIGNALLDVDDAKVAASYAHRFNLQQLQACGGVGGPEASAPDLEFEDESLPRVKIAAPVVCEVLASGYPSMVPVGAFLTLAPYPEKRVQKFVFEGAEDFMELPQAFFHYAAFSSGGKEYVCDIQGHQEDDGSFLFVDPCILRAELPTVGDLVGAVVNNGQRQVVPTSMGPTVERFDALHPRCSQACKTFDPQRRSAQRNGKVGMCGMNGACGMNFVKCGR